MIIYYRYIYDYTMNIIYIYDNLYTCNYIRTHTQWTAVNHSWSWRWRNERMRAAEVVSSFACKLSHSDWRPALFRISSVGRFNSSSTGKPGMQPMDIYGMNIEWKLYWFLQRISKNCKAAKLVGVPSASRRSRQYSPRFAWGGCPPRRFFWSVTGYK